MLQNPYAKPVEEIVGHLHSDVEKGLDKGQVAKQWEQFGPNQIPQDRPKGRWRILADQLFNPINYILMAAAILALVFSDWLVVWQLWWISWFLRPLDLLWSPRP